MGRERPGRERQTLGPDIENVPGGPEALQRGWSTCHCVSQAETRRWVGRGDAGPDQAGRAGLCKEFVVSSGMGATETFSAECHGLTYVLTGSFGLLHEAK